MAAFSSAPSRAEPEAARLACRLARGADELEAHFAVRRGVFVEAQAIFAHNDRDEHDTAPGTLHAVGLTGPRVCGAVRLYPLDADGLWKGDRLAVVASERARRLGALLVAFAVAEAASRGAHRMVAQIQSGNVRFFEGLGWERYGATAPLHGLVHQPMAIALRPPRAADPQDP